jgi:hypothetical protein
MRYAVEVRTAETLDALQALDRDKPVAMPAPEQWISGEGTPGQG